MIQSDYPRPAKISISVRMFKILCEPFVIEPTKYAPYRAAVIVEDAYSGERETLILTASSLCNELEELRKSAGGRLEGLEISIRRESMEKSAKYIVDSA